MSDQARTPRPLPARPNLEYLKKLAKDRLDALRRDRASARLADAQRSVAREHGFASWRKLHAHVKGLSAIGDARGDPAGPDTQIEEFFGAIRRGDETALERHLASEPRLRDARDPDGSTALSVAAETNNVRVVELLMGRGANPRAVYAHSSHTPLSWAVTVGSFEAARALVRGGVELDLFCAAGMGDALAVESFFDDGKHALYA
jgi:ankyrin repeat protein